jgi:hypothetical protein
VWQESTAASLGKSRPAKPTLVFADGSRSPGLLPITVLDKPLGSGKTDARKLAATAP